MNKIDSINCFPDEFIKLDRQKDSLMAQIIELNMEMENIILQHYFKTLPGLFIDRRSPFGRIYLIESVGSMEPSTRSDTPGYTLYCHGKTLSKSVITGEYVAYECEQFLIYLDEHGKLKDKIIDDINEIDRLGSIIK